MIELKGKFNQDCKIFLDEIEDGAVDMIHDILNHPVSEGVQVRIMPDTHIGKGIVIGFTMPITNMVNPNHIGVDIGCSVTSHRLSRRLDRAKLADIDKQIRAAVPMGRATLNKKTYDDWWIEPYFAEVNSKVAKFQQAWEKRFGEKRSSLNIHRPYLTALCIQLGMKLETFLYSVGTLGGGNHFIEVGESEEDKSHFLTIHSGSRHFGNMVCSYHANKMKRSKAILPQSYHDEHQQIIEKSKSLEIPKKLKELKEKYNTNINEVLLQGDDMYLYLVDMIIAQTYAEFNHRAMSRAIFRALGNDFEAVESIYSMHNFIDTSDWIIRKGAIRSYKGEKMIIPFNMRDGILICEGKSNKDWNYSAPHGAGRVLARNQALRTLNMKEFEKEMKGIFSSSVCKATLDESPMAYKNKAMIIDAIADTATILYSVKPILNIKATN